MAKKYFCDGDCGKETDGGTTEVMIRRSGEQTWMRHSLCKDCAAKNVLLLRRMGRYVSDSGFASDVLR